MSDLATKQLKVEDLLIAPGGGEKTGTQMRIIVRSSALGGDFSIMEGSVEPDGLLAAHTHQREDQVIYILEGALWLEVGGKDGIVFEAVEGSYVIKPRGIMHTFWNKGTTTCRYIELSGKDGFENFIDYMGKGKLSGSIKSDKKLGLKWNIREIPRLMKTNKLKSIEGMGHSTDVDDEY